MGTLYTIVPLDQKCAEWLDTEGVPHPPVADSARYPTPREISEALRRLPDYRVAIHSDVHAREWSAQIDADGEMWAQIRVRDFSSEETPHAFYFSRGWPEVVFTVTERLARCCGTLVVVDDSSCRPVVVSPGACRRDKLAAPTIPDAVRTGDADAVLDYAFRQFQSLLVEGRTPRDLEAVAARILEASGAHGYFTGYYGYPSIMCVSFNEETVHTPPSNRAFTSGDLIKIEFGVEKDGEHTFLGWTYPIWTVDAADRRLMAGAKAALEAGVREVRAGNRVGAISRAIQNALNSHNLVPSRDYVGYQIGRQAHMRPPIPCFCEGDEVKGPGMQVGEKLVVLVIAHPESSELRVLRDGWTVVARDGKPSVLFSATVQVVPDGGKLLTKCSPP